MHMTRRLLLALAASALLWPPPPSAGARRRQDPHRLRRHRDGRDAELLDRGRARQGARRRIKVTYFKSEDIAAQAVVGGQADVGVGAPYTVLQKVKAPIRIFYQMSTLRFYPGGQYRVLPGLEGPGRPGDRRPFARLGHRGHHAADGQAPGHQLQQHLLRAGLRGARDRAAAGPCQGHHRRLDQLADHPGERRRQVQAARDRGRRRHRRGTLRQHRVPGARAARPWTSWSRSWSAPGARSTRTRTSSRSCAPSTTCCPTCRPSS